LEEIPVLNKGYRWFAIASAITLGWSAATAAETGGRLKNVTAEQVNAVWRKWIDPHKLAIVIVGPGMAELKKTILDGSATDQSESWAVYDFGIWWKYLCTWSPNCS